MYLPSPQRVRHIKFINETDFLMAQSEGSAPPPIRNPATGFNAEWGQDNQDNQNTFQNFRENCILCVR